MSNFLKIVRNYEAMGELGRKIINHKKAVKNIQYNYELENEYQKQENRIEEFEKKLDETNKLWEKDPLLINEFWTGLS